MSCRNLVTALMVTVLLQQIFGATIKKDSSFFCNGQCNVERARCSCSRTCRKNRKCCTDYRETCEDRDPWIKEECISPENMSCPVGYKNPPPLIVISIDGFRDDYIKRRFTPNIKKLADCGTTAPYLRSAYPTKTFPNHYTIATGLYPESHGIISNYFYNHNIEKEFQLGRKSSKGPHWWGGEPIWVSATNQGLKSATYFWPGSEVNITRYPDYSYPYDETVPNEERIYQTLDWLDLPSERRPSVIMVYTHIVDTAGHVYGPLGYQLNLALRKADEMVEMLMNGLRDRNLDSCVNVMIISDHGMAEVDNSNKNYLENYGINMNEVYTDLGSFARIGKSPNKSLWDKFDSAETMKKVECMRNKTHWEAFLKYEYLPKRYHYSNNPLIEDLHLVADDEAWIQGKNGPFNRIGEHGYDSAYIDMRAFFLGHGSSFKRSYERSTPFESIELYNLMCDLLKIRPAPNNGTKGVLYDLLIQHEHVDQERLGIAPITCPYPNTSIPVDSTGCNTCEGDLPNDWLHLTDHQIKQYQRENMLHERPRIFRGDAKFCILTQKDYVTTYDNVRKMPILASFVVKRKKFKTWEANNCARQDIRIRLDSTTTCSTYHKQGDNWAFLYSPSLSDSIDQSEATITSNMIPVYRPFKHIWEFISQSLAHWATQFGDIAVHAGPIFDYDYDGHADTDEILKAKGNFLDDGRTPIPTHIFIIITGCRDYISNKDRIRKCLEKIKYTDIYSLIIPNYKEAPCHDSTSLDFEWIPASLDRHVARMRDIELLTDISFYSDLVSVEEAKENDILEALRAKVTLPELNSNWWSYTRINISPTPRQIVERTTSATQPLSSRSNSSISFRFLLVLWFFYFY